MEGIEWAKIWPQQPSAPNRWVVKAFEMTAVRAANTYIAWSDGSVSECALIPLIWDPECHLTIATNKRWTSLNMNSEFHQAFTFTKVGPHCKSKLERMSSSLWKIKKWSRVLLNQRFKARFWTKTVRQIVKKISCLRVLRKTKKHQAILRNLTHASKCTLGLGFCSIIVFIISCFGNSGLSKTIHNFQFSKFWSFQDFS